jgi:hypothetical protein
MLNLGPLVTVPYFPPISLAGYLPARSGPARTLWAAGVSMQKRAWAAADR